MTKQTIFWPDGVYYHDKKGFAVLEREGHVIVIDKGLWKKHPIFRMIYPVVENHTGGTYFVEKSLRNYEYWGEL